ncbi:DegT/DnrJ/EryC1/StrS family aminotransferase, partial [Chloroflexota bacterium]
ISVHVGGAIAPDTEQLKDLCQERGITFFEDAAHAHGSKLDGKFAGTFGRASGFSFYPTKVMTSGEGGMIATDDEEVYNRALVFRDQGKSGFAANLHTEIGYNWRLSEVHAVIGLYQLKRLDEFIAARRKIAMIYDQGLEGISGIHQLSLPDNSFSNYYKYIAILDKGIERKELKQNLKQKYNMSLSGEVYELPLHLQPVFSYLGYKEGDFPIAEDICSRQVCLPVFATMSEEQAYYVLESLKEALG